MIRTEEEIQKEIDELEEFNVEVKELLHGSIDTAT